jgi:hypothetical protein
MRNLYGGSLHSFFEERIQQAIEEVDRLDRRTFSDPALAGHLQKIAAKYSFEIAQIRKDDVSGRRKDAARSSTDAWGEQRTFKQTYMVVSIPFSGNKDSFLLSPSRATIPSHAVDIGSSALTINVPDDDGADAAVKTFVQIISDNLDVLRNDYDRIQPQLMEAVNSAGMRRKQKIDAETARDQTRSFKIVN